MNRKVCFNFLLCIICFSTLSAHTGGHYHKSSGIILNSWQLKTGEIIRGNLSMGRDGFILLEQEEGKIVKVAISTLSVQDQLLAAYKLKKIAQLNSTLLLDANNKTKKETFNLIWLFYTSLLFFILLVIVKAVALTQNENYYKKNILTAATYLAFISIVFFACKKTNDTIAAIPKTSTSFIDEAFVPYKPSISTNWDNSCFYVASNGIPAHNMMVGITSWQQRVPTIQAYTGTNSWSIPLQPEYAAIPMSTKSNFMNGAIAIAVNGIPIFNALNNRGEDAYLIGELDNWGGHSGGADDYHYHAAPLHLSTGTGILPIAFALDGFAVYGTKEPDGMAMQALDSCHGHIVNNGVYHYHGTTIYPYTIGAMKGKVTTDPATIAPVNRIIPQAQGSAFRATLGPLNGASITAFGLIATNNYLLTYKQGTKTGYVNYKWDANNKYTFVITDSSGKITTNIYQR